MPRLHTLLPVLIRYATQRDLPELADLEEATNCYPWNEKELAQAIQHREVVCLIAEPPGVDRAIGFLLYEMARTEFVIWRLATAHDQRRRGVARQLVRKLIGQLTPKRRQIVGEVSEWHTAGHLFARKMGFKAVECLRGWEVSDQSDFFRFVYKIM